MGQTTSRKLHLTPDATVFLQSLCIQCNKNSSLSTNQDINISLCSAREPFTTKFKFVGRSDKFVGDHIVTKLYFRSDPEKKYGINKRELVQTYIHGLLNGESTITDLKTGNLLAKYIYNEQGILIMSTAYENDVSGDFMEQRTFGENGKLVMFEEKYDMSDGRKLLYTYDAENKQHGPQKEWRLHDNSLFKHFEYEHGTLVKTILNEELYPETPDTFNTFHVELTFEGSKNFKQTMAEIQKVGFCINGVLICEYVGDTSGIEKNDLCHDKHGSYFIKDTLLSSFETKIFDITSTFPLRYALLANGKNRDSDTLSKLSCVESICKMGKVSLC